jgi:uncharacterized protein YjbI with pentapeptide repeats
MANADHLTLLQQGVDAWNAWRAEELSVKPDFSGADLRGAGLSRANFRLADFSGANLGRANLSRVLLSEAILRGANLRGANLRGAKLREAILAEANLREANLAGAILTGANLAQANLREANLAGAILVGAILAGANLPGANLAGANLAGVDLQRASLVATNLSEADLTGCHVYGMSAWDLNLEGAKQNSLIVTRDGQAEITVDNIEIAQFIYLLLHNEKIRDVIDTITSKAVLILGRFTPERKQVLDALRDELRKQDLLPIIFDFTIPESRDVPRRLRCWPASRGSLLRISRTRLKSG